MRAHFLWWGRQGGTLHVRAARVGQDTALAQIVALVETAQLAKAPIQAYADYVCAVFVPVVVVLAVATWNAWCVRPLQPRPVRSGRNQSSLRTNFTGAAVLLC
jgi:cation transport ATPase